MPLSYAQKLIFLNEIKERKAVLFGSFDHVKDGKVKKANAWEEIRKM